MFDTQMGATLRSLAQGPRWSVLKIGLDLLLWVGLGALAVWGGQPWGYALAAVLIGAVPAHDVLVQGHEAMHRTASRNRLINEFLLWLCHGLMGLSGSAYRAFHLAHHRDTHRPTDPEIDLLTGGKGSPTGASYLKIPLLAHGVLPLWPIRNPSRWANGLTITRDLVAAAALHGGLIWALGTGVWFWLVVTPVFTGLAAVVVIRSVCEHHGASPRSAWTMSRAMHTHPVVEFLWSNVNHHLEHHLYPAMPWHRLPAMRAVLSQRLEQEETTVDTGYLKTALRLIRTRDHFADEPVEEEGAPPPPDVARDTTRNPRGT